MMAAPPAPPRLRRDLRSRRQATASGTILVVKSPSSDGFFRFGEVEGFVAEQLDGETPLDVIRERAEHTFGSPLPAETLDRFVLELGRNGLLETEDAPDPSAPRRRVRGGLLGLRVPLLDPDRMLARLLPHVRFFFTPAFLAGSAALILLAGWITLTNGPELVTGLADLYGPEAIALLLPMVVVLLSAHEFAHAFTCKHFGGEVREMGFMFIYFQPALYCNVSDAWLFPEKAKRVWVSLAGPYLELFLWALSVVAWRLTQPDTWVHQVAIGATAVSGVRSLFNLNPLIKLDGYYILSDSVEIPNLRNKAFAYVGDRVRLLFGLEPRGTIGVPRREARIYLAYGLVAAGCSLALLTYVFVKTGGFLMELHQPALLSCLVALAGVRYRFTFRRLFRRSVQPPVADGRTAAPRRSRGTRRAGKEPHRGRRRRRLFWALVAASGVACVFFGRMELRIAGGFTVLPAERAEVRAAVAGTIGEILVDEGDAVEAGGPVARISGRSLQAALGKVEAALRQAAAELERLRAGPTAEEIAVARAALVRAEDWHRHAHGRVARLASVLETNIEIAEAGVARAAERLEYTRRRRDRVAALRASKIASQEEFEEADTEAALASGDLAEARNRVRAATLAAPRETEEAEATAKAAKNDLAEARCRLALLLRGARPEDVEAARARVAGLEVERRFLEGELRRLDVASPVAGVVATPALELRAMRGRRIDEGAVLAHVFDFRTVIAQMVISEKEIGDVRVGQRVVLRVRAYPDTHFDGVVTTIGTAAQQAASETTIPGDAPGDASGSGRPAGGTFVVTTRIDNGSLRLRPGMTGQAKILAGERRISGLIARRLARTFKVEFWSWW